MHVTDMEQRLVAFIAASDYLHKILQMPVEERLAIIESWIFDKMSVKPFVNDDTRLDEHSETL